MSKTAADLVQGTLDLLLLKILALEPLHGWAISLRLRSLSGDVLQVSEGSLYPALHKLEQEGWIKAEWKQTENNRRAKFYSLTRLGQKAARIGDGELAAAVVRHLARRPALGGVESAMRIEHWWFTAPLRLKSIFRRRRVESELDEELQFHLEHKIEEGIAEGLSPEEARCRALRAMGGLDQRKEEMRDTRAHPLADGLRRRRALRDPEPAPHARADRVRRGHDRARDRDDRDAVQHARRADLPAVPRAAPGRRGHAGEHVPRQRLRHVLLSRVPGHPRPHEELRRRGRQRAPCEPSASAPSPERRRVVRGGMLVSGNYFRVLGVEPPLGRGFRDDEDRGARPRRRRRFSAPDFWKREFASDPSVVGRIVRLNGTDFTVIGVAPESFPGMLIFVRPDFYMPLAMARVVLDRTRRRTSSWTGTTAS